MNHTSIPQQKQTERMLGLLLKSKVPLITRYIKPSSAACFVCHALTSVLFVWAAGEYTCDSCARKTLILSIAPKYLLLRAALDKHGVPQDITSEIASPLWGLCGGQVVSI